MKVIPSQPVSTIQPSQVPTHAIIKPAKPATAATPAIMTRSMDAPPVKAGGGAAVVVTTFWVVEVIEVVEVLVEVVVVTPLELAVDDAAEEEEAEEAEEVELDPALVKVEIIPFPFTGWSVNTLRSLMGSYL